MIGLSISCPKPEPIEIFPRPEFDQAVWDAEEAARTWYGVSLPRRLESFEFIDFAARSWSFAQQVAPAAKLKVSKGMDNACTDGSTIFIPGTYFRQDFYDDIADVGNVTASAVMMVNGSQIHEAFHCLWSTCHLSQSAQEYAPANEIFKKYAAFAAVMNIIEDIFIEAKGRVEFIPLMTFIDAKNNIMLGELPAWKWFNAAYQPTATKDDILQLLVLLKNPRHWMDERWEPWALIKELALRAADATLTKVDRLKIAVDVWNALNEATTSDGASEMPDGAINQVSPDRNVGMTGGVLSPEALEQFLQALGDHLDELIEKALEEMEGEGSSEGSGEPGEEKEGPASGSFLKPMTSSSYDTEASSGVEAIDKKLVIVIEKATLKMDDSDDSSVDNQIKVIIKNIKFERGEGKVKLHGIPTLQFINISQAKTTKSRDQVEEDRSFSKLGYLLRYLRQEKHILGQPRRIGSRIAKTRIYRIATDEKIMAFPDSEHLKKGTPEVNILLDMSGSMESGRLIERVAKAGYGAYMSLVECRVPTGVYGHTSDTGHGSYTPVVYGIAAYNMPFVGKRISTTSNPRQAFTKVVEVGHHQNFDGLAIEFVAQRFTTRPGSKVLIVLSDGEPHGGMNYSGWEAVEHTSQVIRNLNRRGITILSLSLTEDVMESNTRLYGKGNLPAYGGLLERTLQHVVQVISTGKPLT